MVDENNKHDKLSEDIADIKSRYKTEAEEQKEFEQSEPSDWSGYMLGLNLLVSVLICTGLGYIADQFFETGGLLLAAFIVLGFSAGIWQIWKGLDSN